PALSLDRLHLTFNGSEGVGGVPPQFVQVTNIGGGSLTPSVSTNTPWLFVSIVEGDVRVAVRVVGLRPGHYRGRALVTANPDYTENRRQFIDVDLWVAVSPTVPPPPPPPMKSLFLPSIRTK